MRLVQLACDCYVNPEDVTEVKINPASDTITVRMRSGVGHSVGRVLGKTIWATADALKAKLEGQPASV